MGEHRSAKTDLGQASCLGHDAQPPAIVIGDLIATRSLERDGDARRAGTIGEPREKTGEHLRALGSRTFRYLELREQRNLSIVLIEEHEPQLMSVGVGDEMCHPLEKLGIRAELE